MTTKRAEEKAAERELWAHLRMRHIELRDLDTTSYFGQEQHVVRRDSGEILALLHKKGAAASRRWLCVGRRGTYPAWSEWQAAIAMIRAEHPELARDVTYA